MSILIGGTIYASDFTSTSTTGELSILKLIQNAIVTAKSRLGASIIDNIALDTSTDNFIAIKKLIRGNTQEEIDTLQPTQLANLNRLIAKYNELVDLSNTITNKSDFKVPYVKTGEIIRASNWIKMRTALAGGTFNNITVEPMNFGVPVGGIYIVGLSSLKPNTSTSLSVMKMDTETTASPISSSANWSIDVSNVSSENQVYLGSLSSATGKTVTYYAYKGTIDLPSDQNVRIIATWVDDIANKTLTAYHGITVKSGLNSAYRLEEVTRSLVKTISKISDSNNFIIPLITSVKAKLTKDSDFIDMTNNYTTRYDSNSKIVYIEFTTSVYGCNVDGFIKNSYNKSFPIYQIDKIRTKKTTESSPLVITNPISIILINNNIIISFDSTYYYCEIDIHQEKSTISLLEGTKDLYYIIWATPLITTEPEYVYISIASPIASFSKLGENGSLTPPNVSYIYDYPGYNGIGVIKVSDINVSGAISVGMYIEFKSLPYYFEGIKVNQILTDTVLVYNNCSVADITINETALNFELYEVKGIYETDDTGPSRIQFDVSISYSDFGASTTFTEIGKTNENTLTKWSVVSGGGTIDSITGVYTAPNDVIGVPYRNVTIKVESLDGTKFDSVTFAIFNKSDMTPTAIQVRELSGNNNFVEGTKDLYYLVEAIPTDTIETPIYIVEVPTDKVTLSYVSGNCTISATKTLVTDYVGYVGKPIIKISNIIAGSGGEYGLLNVSFKHPFVNLVCSAPTVRVFNNSQPKSLVILQGSLVNVSGSLGIYESKDGIINRTTFTARITLQDDSIFDKNADSSMVWSIFTDPTGNATIDQSGLFTAPEVQTTTNIMIKAVYTSAIGTIQTGTYEFKIFNIAQLTSISFADNNMGLPSTFNILENTELQLYAFANYNDGGKVEITNESDAVWDIAANPDNLTLSTVEGLFHVENVAFDSLPIVRCTYKGILTDPLNNILPRTQVITVRNISDIQISNGVSAYTSPTNINEGTTYPIVIKALLSNNETKNITTDCTFTLLNPTTNAIVQPSLTRYPFCQFGAPGELIVGNFTDDQVVKLKVDYKTHSKTLIFNLIDLNYLLSIEISGGKAELIENDYTTFSVAAMLDDLSTYTPTTGIIWSILSYGTIPSSYLTIDQTGKLTTGDLPLNANSNITIRASLTRKGITKTATKTVKIYDAFTGNEVLSSISISNNTGDCTYLLGNSAYNFTTFATFTENTKQITKPIISTNWSLTYNGSYATINSSGKLTLDDNFESYTGAVTGVTIKNVYTYKTITKDKEIGYYVWKATNNKLYIDEKGRYCRDLCGHNYQFINVTLRDYYKTPTNSIRAEYIISNSILNKYNKYIKIKVVDADGNVKPPSVYLKIRISYKNNFYKIDDITYNYSVIYTCNDYIILKLSFDPSEYNWSPYHFGEANVLIYNDSHQDGYTYMVSHANLITSDYAYLGLLDDQLTSDYASNYPVDRIYHSMTYVNTYMEFEMLNVPQKYIIDSKIYMFSTRTCYYYFEGGVIKRVDKFGGITLANMTTTTFENLTAKGTIFGLCAGLYKSNLYRNGVCLFPDRDIITAPDNVSAYFMTLMLNKFDNLPYCKAVLSRDFKYTIPANYSNALLGKPS